MIYYDHFILPFTIGVITLFSVIIYSYVRWYLRLPAGDKRLVGRYIFTSRSLAAIRDVFSESLLHRNIFRRNPLLGYMHMSLAFGWFLLIAVGWIETTLYLGGRIVPPYTHVFFKFFAPRLNSREHYPVMANIMDALLLFVLSGVALAWFKRLRSKALGMRRTTKHTLGDRAALAALWFIFPARLLAESITSGIIGSHTFLTGSLGGWMASHSGMAAMQVLQPAVWLFYSSVLGIFFVALPFSRYMHIFTEVPLIFLRRYKVRSNEFEKSFDRFQIAACSRCGICIDPCQLQSAAGMNDVQSVYFLRDRRHNMLTEYVADNCLMCGRCEAVCPVGIELNMLRLNSRSKSKNTPAEGRYDYIKGVDRSQGEGAVGYFAGCMTLLTPTIIDAMQRIFEVAGESVWWADRDGGVCCGRPLKLAGEVSAARKIMELNEALFAKHDIDTLVTSCPICLKVFKEEYLLSGIEVLHHTEYILRLIKKGKIAVTDTGEKMAYHDPCELGRGCGIYSEPREIISRIGRLAECRNHSRDALCCGSSLANTQISDAGQNAVSRQLNDELAATGASTVVTACPLCKKAIVRNSHLRVCDISEIVANGLQVKTKICN